MKAVLLLGANATQRRLAERLCATLDVRAIVVSDNVPARPKSRTETIRSLGQRIEGRLLGFPFARAWSQLQRHYESLSPSWPDRDRIRVRNVNDPETHSLLRRIDPELVLVSGTNLVGRKTIELADRGRGILNLHTGISPYIKGGPNCTNWCLAERRYDLIGSTIMWLDAGIDTGALVATERAPLTGREHSLLDLHIAVMEHAHDLYARAARAVAMGLPVARVPQSRLGEGKTYFTRDWNSAAMARALLGWRAYPGSPASTSVELVPLPEI